MAEPTPSIIELALQHGASSYRNRADTNNPAYGFTEEGLQRFADALLARAPQAVAAQAPAAVAVPETREELAKRLDSERDYLEAIKLPPHNPTLAIEDILNEYEGDDREEVWESIKAYAEGQARGAVLIERDTLAATPALPATEDSSAGDQAEPDAWHQAVLDACMATEACYVAGDAKASLDNLIDWHIDNERRDPAEVQAVGKPANPHPVNTSRHEAWEKGFAGREMKMCAAGSAYARAHLDGAAARTAMAAPQAEVQAEPVAEVLGWVRKKNGEIGSHFYTYEPHCDCAVRDDGGEKIAVVAATAPQAQPADALDAKRLDWMIEQRTYVVSDETCCDGYWLHWARPDGSTWVQGSEYETPRAAIDAAMAAAQEGNAATGKDGAA